MEDTDIERWRHRYGTFLGKASKVFAPSVWARDTLTEYYPGTRVTLAPPWKGMPDHVPARGVSNGWALPNDECRHVGVLGAIGPEKGARHLDRLAARIRERGLPLRLVLVGYTDCVNRDQSPDRVLTIHGPYRSEEIEALFDYYGIAVVVFPSVWPETFSYTLGETWKAGRPALVPPVGALRERVAATGAGWIMDGWPDPDRVLDQLMTLTAPGNSGELARTAQLAKSAFQTGHDGTDPMSGYYADMLSDAIQNTGHVVSRLQILDAACRALGIERSTQPADPVSTGPVRAGASGRRLFRLFRG
jgi:hypothetical protein